LYIVNPGGTDSSSPPCGYEVVFIWTSASAVTEVNVYTPPGPGYVDLGDCDDLLGTSVPLDVVSQGYLTGFSASLGA